MSTWRPSDGLTIFAPAPGASNVSVVTDHGRALVIDSGAIPSVTGRFLQAEGVGTIDVCVLTHLHADHVFGVTGVEAPEVVASSETKRLLAERCDTERGILLKVFPDAAEELQATAAPEITRVLDTEEVIQVGGRTLRLIPLGHGHTPGDLIVFDERTRTVFAGDLVFAGLVPVLRDADSRGWLRALQTIKDLDPDIVVPGHGAPGPASVIDDMSDLIAALRDIASTQDPDDISVSIKDLPEHLRGLGRTERLGPAIASIVAETP